MTLPTIIESRIEELSWSICSFFFNHLLLFYQTHSGNILNSVWLSPSIAGLKNMAKRWLLACLVDGNSDIWTENAKLTTQTVTADFCSTCELYGEDLNQCSPFFFYSPRCQGVEGGWMYYIIIKRHEKWIIVIFNIIYVLIALSLHIFLHFIFTRTLRGSY